MDRSRTSPLLVARAIVRGILGTAMLAAILFVPAGSFAWPDGLAFFSVALVGVSASTWRMYRSDPELLRERVTARSKARGWDRVILLLYSFTLTAMLVLAGLDAARFEWSAPSFAVKLAGWGAFALGGATGWWALATNPFASEVARIQEDREQRVITSGPYRFVRHPMYVGIILATPGIALLLGSYWALVPAAGIIALFVVRTALEDRMLREELAGYEAFIATTRYRLVPRIW